MGYGFDETQLANASPYSIRNRKNPIPLTSPTQETHILSRLKRRASSTEVDTQSSSSRTVEDDGSRPKNAFDTMIKAAKRSRDTIIKSNLVDEQAEESDEDNGWAPIGGPEDDDEDNDEDGYVPDLLDDEQVDEEEEKRQDELAAEKARYVQNRQLLSRSDMITGRWQQETMHVEKLRRARSLRGSIVPSAEDSTFTRTTRMTRTSLAACPRSSDESGCSGGRTGWTSLVGQRSLPSEFWLIAFMQRERRTSSSGRTRRTSRAMWSPSKATLSRRGEVRYPLFRRSSLRGRLGSCLGREVE